MSAYPPPASSAGTPPPVYQLGPDGYYAPPQQRTNVLAIITLCLSLTIPLAGIFTGHIALRQLRTSGEAGHGMAQTGLIISYCLTGLITLVVLFYLFVFLLFGGLLLAFFSAISSPL